ncbi:Non-specific lipid-transfer protein 4.1 [Triticum urartu]|uniref:Non-specific lipid-transfer protein 4.1 n=1 Tax=Triticum urartu TaxID=4572 RepID=M7Z941_TRIUA|nr:Non-specific lipid-transfer protein 4.1 [Triticum urartu]
MAGAVREWSSRPGLWAHGPASDAAISCGQTAADKKAACLCIKSAAGGVKEGKAAEIPSKCRVSVPYKISSTVNCNKI